MNNINVESVPKSFKSEFLGSGLYGRCYKTEDGKVFKEYKNPFCDCNNIARLSKLKSDVFVFPETLVFRNDLLLGYLMKYIDGNSFNNIDKSIELKRLIEEIKRLEQELINLSIRHLAVEDVNQSNIFIDKSSNIKVIDTDDYYIDTRKYEDAIFEDSLTKISPSILHGILGDNLFFKNKKLLYDKASCLFGGILMSDFLSKVFNELSLNTSNRVETLGELQDNINLILR